MSIQKIELTEELLKKIYLMRDHFIKRYDEKTLYGYQRDYSDALIKASLAFLGEVYYVEISRQAGKTVGVSLTICFLLIYINRILEWLGVPLNGPFKIFLGAPQQEQAKTDFDNVKDFFKKIKMDYDVSYDEANGTTLKLADTGNTVFCMPVNVTSKIESKTAHLIIMEEMQDVSDVEYEKKVMPMGTATNANTIMIGTAGYKICNFYKGVESGRKGYVFKYDCYEVIRQKIARYKEDGNPFHLNYVKYVQAKIAKLGLDNPQIQTQYLLKWQLETGMWITEEKFNAMVADGKDGRPHYPIVREDLKSDCYSSLDVAKESDVSFDTMMRCEGYKDVKRKVPALDESKNQIEKTIVVKAPVWRVLNWFMINGALYQDQWDAIDVFLARYKVFRHDVDSTGVGDATGDYYLKKYNKWSWDVLKRYERLGLRGVARPVKFTLQSKHAMYLNWWVAIKEGRYWIPDPASMNEVELKCFKRFKNESLNAVREWKGSLLNVRHVDKSKGESGDVETDDSLDSAALPFHDIDAVPHKVVVRTLKRK